eukprot:jgi/Botrbrau1/21620/Bobra.43_1s0023.1
MLRQCSRGLSAAARAALAGRHPLPANVRLESFCLLANQADPDDSKRMERDVFNDQMGFMESARIILDPGTQRPQVVGRWDWLLIQFFIALLPGFAAYLLALYAGYMIRRDAELEPVNAPGRRRAQETRTGLRGRDAASQPHLAQRVSALEEAIRQLQQEVEREGPGLHKPEDLGSGPPAAGKSPDGRKPPIESRQQEAVSERPQHRPATTPPGAPPDTEYREVQSESPPQGLPRVGGPTAGSLESVRQRTSPDAGDAVSAGRGATSARTRSMEAAHHSSPASGSAEARTPRAAATQSPSWWLINAVRGLWPVRAQVAEQEQPGKGVEGAGPEGIPEPPPQGSGFWRSWEWGLLGQVPSKQSRASEELEGVSSREVGNEDRADVPQVVEHGGPSQSAESKGRSSHGHPPFVTLSPSGGADVPGGGTNRGPVWEGRPGEEQFGVPER